MKKHPIQSNIKSVATQQVQYDPAFDKHWEFDRCKTTHKRGPSIHRGSKLPTPLETRLALQSSLAIAAHERAGWVEANRDKIIAAARAELNSKLNRN